MQPLLCCLETQILSNGYFDRDVQQAFEGQTMMPTHEAVAHIRMEADNKACARIWHGA